jgi:hypothetical protein
MATTHELGRYPFLRAQLPAERPTVRDIAEQSGVLLEAAIVALSPHERTQLGALPLDPVIASLGRYRPGAVQGPIAPGLRAVERELKATGGEGCAATYSRLLIAALLARLPTAMPRFLIPELAWPAIERDLTVLLEALREGYGFEDWTAELFSKDLVAAQFRGPPHDGMVIHTRRFRPALSARDASAAERLHLLRYLGRAYFQWGWYTGSHVWRGYKEHGRLHWSIRMERTAAIAAINPQIRGQAAAGWYCDPKVAAISPGVAAKFVGLAGIGARSYHMRTGADAVRDALVASATRRALYDAGKYTPAVYGNLLKRDDLLVWAFAAWERGDSAAALASADSAANAEV